MITRIQCYQKYKYKQHLDCLLLETALCDYVNMKLELLHHFVTGVSLIC